MKKYNMVISIPVHEKSETVIDTIINFKHYNANTAIVLHISKIFNYQDSLIKESEFYDILNKIEDVYINPEHMVTDRYTLAKIHVSNFQYIVGVADFYYYVMAASNMLFIRSNMFDYFKSMQYEATGGYLDIKKTPEWPQSVCLRDKAYLSFLNKTGINSPMGGQIDGSVYNKEMMQTMADTISAYFDFEERSENYATEEVLFPTIAYSFFHDAKKQMLNITYMNWEYNLLVFEHQLVGLAEKYFSVKRVPRELNDDLRTFIRDYYMNGYHQFSEKYLKAYLRSKPKKVIILKDFVRYVFVKIKHPFDRLFLRAKKFVKNILAKKRCFQLMKIS